MKKFNKIYVFFLIASTIIFSLNAMENYNPLTPDIEAFDAEMGIEEKGSPTPPIQRWRSVFRMSDLASPETFYHARAAAENNGDPMCMRAFNREVKQQTGMFIDLAAIDLTDTKKKLNFPK